MDPTVLVTGGRVRGRTLAGVSAFLGIPYAAPPVGPARFRAPAPAPRWDGVRDALQHGASAIQSLYAPPIAALIGSVLIPGDNPLHLNIWTPDVSGSGLPVMVWLHGGAFTRGSTAIPAYDGTAFARDGVVLVAVNYRLGITGFGAVDGAPANRGLRDQLFALAWVQENIRAFGGDPDNVTVFGESGGGMSVATLMSSTAADDLFRRAVVQSGNATAVADEFDARHVTAEVAERLGIPATADDFGQVGSKELAAAQTAVGLALAQDPDPGRWGRSVVRNGLGVMSFFPCVDGDIVTGVPVDLIADGAAGDVALLTGTTTEEFRFFLVPTGLGAMVTTEALPLVLSRYGLDPSVVDVYAAARPSATAGDLLAAVLTDHAFRAETVRLADAQTASGGRAHMYEFAWRSGVPGLGACHALELPFVFDTLDSAHRLSGPNPPQRLADEMHSAWVAFATNGEPGWPEYQPGDRTVQTFDGPGSTLVRDPRADELRALRHGRPRDPGAVGSSGRVAT